MKEVKKKAKPDDKRRILPQLFKKGQSGNPAGRPRGNGRIGWFNTVLGNRKKDVVEKAIEKALKGDKDMLEVLLNRMIPAYAPTDDVIEIEGYQDAKTRTERAELISKNIAEGQITPNQGIAIMTVLEKSAKIQEVDDITKRLEEVEKLVKS